MPNQQQQKKSTVGVAVVMLVVTAGLGYFLWQNVQDQRRQERVLKSGTTAPATVTGIQSTDTYNNRKQVYRVILSVKPEGQEAFQAQDERPMTSDQRARLKVVAKLHVRFNPQDRTSLVVLY